MANEGLLMELKKAIVCFYTQGSNASNLEAKNKINIFLSDFLNNFPMNFVESHQDPLQFCLAFFSLDSSVELRFYGASLIEKLYTYKIQHQLITLSLNDDELVDKFLDLMIMLDPREPTFGKFCQILSLVVLSFSSDKQDGILKLLHNQKLDTAGSIRKFKVLEYLAQELESKIDSIMEYNVDSVRHAIPIVVSMIGNATKIINPDDYSVNISKSSILALSAWSKLGIALNDIHELPDLFDFVLDGIGNIDLFSSSCQVISSSIEASDAIAEEIDDTILEKIIVAILDQKDKFWMAAKDEGNDVGEAFCLAIAVLMNEFIDAFPDYIVNCNRTCVLFLEFLNEVVSHDDIRVVESALSSWIIIQDFQIYNTDRNEASDDTFRKLYMDLGVRLLSRCSRSTGVALDDNLFKRFRDEYCKSTFVVIFEVLGNQFPVYLCRTLANLTNISWDQVEVSFFALASISEKILDSLAELEIGAVKCGELSTLLLNLIQVIDFIFHNHNQNIQLGVTIVEFLAAYGAFLNFHCFENCFDLCYGYTLHFVDGELARSNDVISYFAKYVNESTTSIIRNKERSRKIIEFPSKCLEKLPNAGNVGLCSLVFEMGMRLLFEIDEEYYVGGSVDVLCSSLLSNMINFNPASVRLYNEKGHAVAKSEFRIVYQRVWDILFRMATSCTEFFVFKKDEEFYQFLLSSFNALDSSVLMPYIPIATNLCFLEIKNSRYMSILCSNSTHLSIFLKSLNLLLSFTFNFQREDSIFSSMKMTETDFLVEFMKPVIAEVEKLSSVDRKSNIFELSPPMYAHVVNLLNANYSLEPFLKLAISWLSVVDWSSIAINSDIELHVGMLYELGCCCIFLSPSNSTKQLFHQLLDFLSTTVSNSAISVDCKGFMTKLIQKCVAMVMVCSITKAKVPVTKPLVLKMLEDEIRIERFNVWQLYADFDSIAEFCIQNNYSLFGSTG